MPIAGLPYELILEEIGHFSPIACVSL